MVNFQASRICIAIPKGDKARQQPSKYGHNSKMNPPHSYCSRPTTLQFRYISLSASLIYFAPSGASPDGIFARQALFTS
nr:MAG TPA: hypothetical protein [Inoviridae sp.]